MKTDDLVVLLASSSGPVDRAMIVWRYSWALSAGTLGAIILMMMRFGIRPDIGTVAQTSLFWLKLAFPTIVAIGALLLFVRLSRPGMLTNRRWIVVAVPVIAVWLGALVALWMAPASERLPMVLGSSWRTCPFNIAFLSTPGFIAIFWAIRGMAPTRLRAAGAVSGLLASSIATMVYCLHCPEMEVPFWAVWYLAGLLLPAALGALLGPRLLRW